MPLGVAARVECALDFQTGLCRSGVSRLPGWPVRRSIVARMISLRTAAEGAIPARRRASGRFAAAQLKFFAAYGFFTTALADIPWGGCILSDRANPSRAGRFGVHKFNVGKRSQVETAIGRYKSIIGLRLPVASCQANRSRHRLRRPQPNACVRTPEIRPPQRNCGIVISRQRSTVAQLRIHVRVPRRADCRVGSAACARSRTWPDRSRPGSRTNRRRAQFSRLDREIPSAFAKSVIRL